MYRAAEAAIDLHSNLLLPSPPEPGGIERLDEKEKATRLSPTLQPSSAKKPSTCRQRYMLDVAEGDAPQDASFLQNHLLHVFVVCRMAIKIVNDLVAAHPITGVALSAEHGSLKKLSPHSPRLPACADLGVSSSLPLLSCESGVCSSSTQFPIFFFSFSSSFYHDQVALPFEDTLCT